MKTSLSLIPALAAAFILHPSSFLLAQGLLTPPGAPAPTMKTLTQISDQITPIRADTAVGITAAPFTIATSGHYYLKNNVSVATGTAITIDADNVTLDLNGFTISSTASPSSGSGININGVRKNIQIRNGFINGTTTVAAGVFTTGGFTSGILSASVSSRTIVITDIHVSGVGNSGINLADADVPATIVDRCTVSISGNFGIVAHTVRTSSATDCGGRGIWATIVGDSTGGSLGAQTDDDGIFATNVDNCRGSASAGDGIESGKVNNSYGTSSSGTGISASTSVTNSYGSSPTGTGISAPAVTNSRGSTGGGTGISGENITNCHGLANPSPAGTGISGTNISNSSGISNGGGNGIYCTGSVTNSFGQSAGAALTPAILVSGTASFCRGRKINGGTVIEAAIAIGCTVFGGGIITAPEKHLGTP